LSCSRPTAAHPSSRALNCAKEEADAFWCWAVVEVLRRTGLRCEELLELTHLSIRQYRPPKGKVVLLLQIAPSEMDRERVIPVCPELAHALARIVARVRGDSEALPLAQRWDPHEQVFSPPLPFQFQRRQNGSQCVMGWSSIVGLLDRAARNAGLRDVDGQSLFFRPHDLRRIFATDAVNGGLPVHIAAKLLGHLDINTTQGYVAVYDDQVIRHVQAYVARRRATRPSEEYREPTPAEWIEFEQHFRRRKMALGDCFRPYETDCPHEHACVRCPMLRMDPVQFPRLVLIAEDTHRLLDEARQKGWEGEVLGLQTMLGHLADKKAQVERLHAHSPSTATSVAESNASRLV
jgi:integrase